MAIIANDFPEKISLYAATLRRMAGARMDPYTRYVSYILFRDLNISVHGQRHMNNALSNLPVYQSVAPDEKLSFGWGDTSAIRDKTVHEGSYAYVAMMIALGESFHEAYAAKVLTAMAAAAAGPTDVTPHFSQWKAALHGCNGAFATTDFGLLVEDYIRVDPYPIIRTADIQSIFTPTLVAAAIRALVRVTAGHEQQITLTGSAIISWFGAVAEWLCGLRIAAYSARGEELHATHPDQVPQVVLVFVKDPSLRYSFEPFHQEHIGVGTLSLQEQTYASAVHSLPFGGRVEWQSLLPRVFGKSFHFLDHDESKAFGTMIGSAARLFEALARGEAREEHGDLVSTPSQSNTASYGAGLIQTITNWFPELRRFQGRMERPLKKSHGDAADSYRDALNHIRKACDCGICKAQGDLQEGQDGVPPPHGYCLTVLVEMIIALGLCLSRMAVAPRLFPARAGIQSFHQSQVAKRLEARGRHWTEHFKIVYGNEWNAPDARRLQNAVQIFAGSRPERDIPENLVALTHEGACAYFVALEKPSRPDKEQVKLIRVVSGAINVHEKVFDRACLGAVAGEDPDDPWEEVAYAHLPEPLFFK